MFIASICGGNQAPLGAACRARVVTKDHMPLLTELENSVVGPHSYKHAAPNGAIAPALSVKYPGQAPSVVLDFGHSNFGFVSDFDIRGANCKSVPTEPMLSRRIWDFFVFFEFFAVNPPFCNCLSDFGFSLRLCHSTKKTQ
jgi:hypothetical protein